MHKESLKTSLQGQNEETGSGRTSEANDAMGASVPEVRMTQRVVAETSRKAMAGFMHQRLNWTTHPLCSASSSSPLEETQAVWH